MNISVALDDCKTLIAVVDSKKGQFRVRSLSEKPSVLTQLVNGNVEAVADLFDEIKHELKKKYVTLELGLPTYLFRLNYEESQFGKESWYRMDDKALSFLENMLGLNPDSAEMRKLNISMHNGLCGVSAGALSMKYIKTIMEAAEWAEVDIASIQPSAFALARMIENERFGIIEFFNKLSLVTSFHPEGIYTVPFMGISKANFDDSKLGNVLQIVDELDQRSFGNSGVPLYCESSLNGHERLAQLPLSIRFLPGDYSEYLVALGLLTIDRKEEQDDFGKLSAG